MSEETSLQALLAFFFYEHGYLIIPGLGRFDLLEDSKPDSDHPHTHQAFPKGSIRFTFNIREEPDDILIDYIISHSRKMRALAISDLDSVADLTKEILNLNQSYSFPGIGTIIPSLSGAYEVIPGKIISNPAALKTSAPPPVHQGDLNPVIREGEVHSPGSRRTVGGILITVVCVIIIGILLYFLFFRRKGESITVEPETNKEILNRTIPDSAKTSQVVDDGLLHYEVIFEHATYDRALYRYHQLTGWGHHIILHTKDSVNFLLAVPVVSSAADTTRVKDSIRLLYGHPVSIGYLSR